MKHLLCLFLVGFSLLHLTSAHADELLDSYTARLSARDHFNSSGERLTSAAAIIRQDRANYHKFNRRDPEDLGDSYFASADHRALLEQHLERGSSTPAALRTIVNGTPMVQVSVFKDGARNYYAIVQILEE